MNLQLPPERDVPDADGMLARITGSPRPRASRARGWARLAIALVAAVTVLAATQLNNDLTAELPLATPTQSADTSLTPTRPTPTRTARQVAWPAEWTTLLDQHRMADPPIGTTAVAIHEVGLDGALMSVRENSDVDHSSVLEFGSLNRGDTVIVQELGGQTSIGAFDTDGTSYLFMRQGTRPERYLWRPGFIAPQLIDTPAADKPTSSQLQQNGYSVWLAHHGNPGDNAPTDLVITQQGDVLHTMTLPSATSIAARGNIVWVLLADGSLVGLDLTTGNPTPVEEDLPPLTALASDGRTLLTISADGISVAFDSATTIKIDTADSHWQVSGQWASWQAPQRDGGPARHYLMDLRTGAYTEIPAAQSKGGIVGVRNDHLIVADDARRPAVVPLAALGGLG